MTLLLRSSIRTACNKATSDPPNKLSSISYCVNQVKKFDRENYLAAIFIDDIRMKRVVFALRAFNVELSLVRDSTTNSDRAKLRFHFWSKLVDEIIRRNDDHYINMDKLKAYYNYAPVAKELLDLFYLVELDEVMKRRLRDLIGSRISPKVLGYQPFETLEELELYCAKSNSSIYHLAFSMSHQARNTFNVKENTIQNLESISDKLGIAHGLSNIIRGVKYNSGKNCCYVPKDILDESELTVRDFTGKNFDGKRTAPAVRKLSLRCQELLNISYNTSKKLSKYHRQLFLPRVAIQDNLKRLAKCDYDLTDPRLGARNGLLPFNFWMASKFSRAPIL